MRKQFLIAIEVYSNEYVVPKEFSTEREARAYLAENPISTQDARLLQDITKKRSKKAIEWLASCIGIFTSAIIRGASSMKFQAARTLSRSTKFSVNPVSKR